MFYKVLKDDKVVDVLNEVVYLKWQPRNRIMLLSELKNAQAILSSDGETIWHEITLHDLPVDGYDTVELIPIDEYEYKQLKMFNCKSLDEVLDEYTLLLISEGVI